jgi:hypothetical protein
MTTFTDAASVVLTAILIVIAAYLISGCAQAIPAAMGLASGGVSLYKSEKSSGPKAEFVLVKVESNHIVYQNP